MTLQFFPDVALTETLSQHQVQEHKAAEQLSGTSCETLKKKLIFFFLLVFGLSF